MTTFLIGLIIGIFAGGAGGYLWGQKVRDTVAKVETAVKG